MKKKKVIKRFSFKNIKKDSKGFYMNPEMVGHRWAKETLDTIEEVVNKYGATKLQKYIINNVMDFDVKSDDDSWYVFNRWSKKDVNNLCFVLRRIDKMKDGMYELLYMLDRRSSLMKDRLTWVMEYLAWQYDKDVYIKEYVAGMKFYGMESVDAEQRVTKYIEKLETKHNFKINSN